MCRSASSRAVSWSWQNYTDMFEGVIAELRSKPWDESLDKRVGAVKRLYGDVDNFDSIMLGGLEIFAGKAFENLKENPLKDRQFPRSFSHCLHEVKTCLSYLPNNEPPLRLVTRSLRGIGKFDPVRLPREELRRFLDNLQLRISEIHYSIGEAYFSSAVTA